MANSQKRPVEEAIGTVIRNRRRQLGLSQKALGELIGVTAQQIHKYERGAPLHIQRLVEFSQVLRYPLHAFFAPLGASPDFVTPSSLTLREPDVPFQEIPPKESTPPHEEDDTVVELCQTFLSLEERTQQALRVIIQALRPYSKQAKQ